MRPHVAVLYLCSWACERAETLCTAQTRARRPDLGRYRVWSRFSRPKTRFSWSWRRFPATAMSRARPAVKRGSAELTGSSRILNVQTAKARSRRSSDHPPEPTGTWCRTSSWKLSRTGTRQYNNKNNMFFQESKLYLNDRLCFNISSSL